MSKVKEALQDVLDEYDVVNNDFISGMIVARCVNNHGTIEGALDEIKEALNAYVGIFGSFEEYCKLVCGDIMKHFSDTLHTLPFDIQEMLHCTDYAKLWEKNWMYAFSNSFEFDGGVVIIRNY